VAQEAEGDCCYRNLINDLIRNWQRPPRWRFFFCANRAGGTCGAGSSGKNTPRLIPSLFRIIAGKVEKVPIYGRFRVFPGCPFLPWQGEKRGKFRTLVGHGQAPTFDAAKAAAEEALAQRRSTR
jgi:hypothetical protein